MLGALFVRDLYFSLGFQGLIMPQIADGGGWQTTWLLLQTRTRVRHPPR